MFVAISAEETIKQYFQYTKSTINLLFFTTSITELINIHLNKTKTKAVTLGLNENGK